MERVLRVPDDPEIPAIEHVTPDVDGGRFAAKRVVGDVVVVEADVFAYGHGELTVRLEHRRKEERRWRATWMTPLGNDRYRGEFPVHRIGEYRFRILGWRDAVATWRHAVEAKLDAGQDVALDAEEGARLVEEVVKRAERATPETDALLAWVPRLRAGVDARTRAELDELVQLARTQLCRPDAAVYDTTSPIWVDRPLARSSAWYELFARSASPDATRAGTFDDVAARLPEVAAMGFDVVYLPPIHPIGRVHRKGPNNTRDACPGDPGSPWAIGSDEGGHTAVHPGLGTLADFDRLVRAARRHDMEIALDLAFQCAPDHPWVREHPEWFRHRADGSIAYAENPPKRYEDIVPIDFECEDRAGLWGALLEVVRFWADRGVRIFRVDNPHTKPFGFWEWLIDRVRDTDPDIVFLSEAFTRPRVMERLAKVGFTQSYTYFTWRNEKWELADYFAELSRPPMSDFFRPNAWPNTPDILHETLQHGSRGTFLARATLAACLSANWGVYGPAFELMERTPRERGSEEYVDSEKYEVRHWDLHAGYSLAPYLARLNAIRRAHAALQRNTTLRFHDIDNDALLCWSKTWDDDRIVCIVNLDPWTAQSGWTHLDLDALGIEDDAPFVVHDLLTDAQYEWRGAHNFVLLDPAAVPAHVLEMRGGTRT
jgi:starch synthase (maltosyl-transferring)